MTVAPRLLNNPPSLTVNDGDALFVGAVLRLWTVTVRLIAKFTHIEHSICMVSRRHLCCMYRAK